MPGQPAVGSNPFITFDVTDMTIHEIPPGGVIGQPSTIIPNTSGFRVEVNFDLAGLFATYIAGKNEPYKITLRAESMGGGFEGDIGNNAGNLVTGQLQYGHGHPNQVPVVVPAGTLAEGIYRLSAVVSFTAGVHPPLFGFADGPVIEIYAP